MEKGATMFSLTVLSISSVVLSVVFFVYAFLTDKDYDYACAKVAAILVILLIALTLSKVWS